MGSFRGEFRECSGNIIMEDPIMDEPMEDGVPEATVETVPDHIEAAYEEPTTLDYIKYNVLGYFSNPWAMLILLFLMYKLYRLISPMITEPLAERWSQWQQKREEQAEAAEYKKNPDKSKSGMTTCREKAIKTELKRVLIKKEKLSNSKPELRERKVSEQTTTTL